MIGSCGAVAATMHKLKTRWTAFGAVGLCLLGGATAPASAATVRVEKDGSGDYTVIQDAVDAAAVGDTILVGPGRYDDFRPFTTDLWTEDTYVAVTVDSLTIRGTSRDSVVVGPTVPDFQGYGPKGFVMSREIATFLRVESLRVENVHDGFHIFHTAQLNAVRVMGCNNGITAFGSSGTSIQSSQFDGCYLGVFTGSGVEDITIMDCEFRDNFLGIGINRTSGALVQDCILIGGGVQYGDYSTGTVRNCQVSGERGVVRAVIASDLYLDGNRIDGDVVSLRVDGFSRISGSGNIVMGGSQAAVRMTGNSISDFHGNHILKGEGPSVLCVDYGTEPVQIDLIGNYWGTTSADSIRAWIVDGEDLHNPPVFKNYSEVLFEPFHLQPVATEKQSMGSLKAQLRRP